MQNLLDPSALASSTTRKVPSLCVILITPFRSIASTFFWIVSLAAGPIPYSRCVRCFDPSWIAMHFCPVLIWPTWPFRMKQCLDIIWFTACWRLTSKWLSLRVSNNAVCPFSGVAESNTGGKFRFLSVLFGIVWFFTKPKPRVVIVAAARGVRLTNAVAMIWPIKTWCRLFAKFAISNQDTLLDSSWAALFGQIISCFSENLGFGCIATNPWSFVCTGTQAGFCAGMSIVDNSWTNGDGTLPFVLCQVGSLASCCGVSCCTSGLRRIVGTVVSYTSSMYLSLGRIFRTN